MTTEYYEQLLKEYSEEMKLHSTLTLKDLINSHTYLRNLNLEKQETMRDGYKAGYDAGYEYGKNVAQLNDWFSKERLQKMSVAELVDHLKIDSL